MLSSTNCTSKIFSLQICSNCTFVLSSFSWTLGLSCHPISHHIYHIITNDVCRILNCFDTKKMVVSHSLYSLWCALIWINWTLFLKNVFIVRNTVESIECNHTVHLNQFKYKPKLMGVPSMRRKWFFERKLAMVIVIYIIHIATTKIAPVHVFWIVICTSSPPTHLVLHCQYKMRLLWWMSLLSAIASFHNLVIGVWTYAFSL